MLKNSNIDIYWFSGSGNSLLIAMKTQEAFRFRNFQTNLIPIVDVKDASKINTNCIIGIIVPVAAQSTYPIVWQFINNLPKVEQTKVFFIDTLAKFSGGIIGPVKKVLGKKGFDCIGAKEIIMPNSMAKNKIDDYDEKIFAGIKNSVAFVDLLVFEKAKWNRIFLLSDIMRSFSKPRSLWEKMATKINVDQNLCTKCYICEKICPLNAINIVDNYPKINSSICMSCLRCLNYCPVNAFTFNQISFQQNKPVKLKAFMEIKDEN